MNGNGPDGPSRSHTSNIVSPILAATACTKFQSSLLYISFRLSGTQAPLELITSATNGIDVHSAPKYGTKPIRCAWRSTSLRHRKRAAKTVLLCERKPFPVWFSRRRKSYPVKCEHILSYDMSSSMLSINLLCIYRVAQYVQRTWRSDHTSSGRLQVVKYKKWSRSLTGSGGFFARLWLERFWWLG